MTPTDSSQSSAAEPKVPKAGPQDGERKFSIEELREGSALRLGVGQHVLDGALVAFNVKKATMTVSEARQLVERYKSYVPEVS